MALIGRTPNAQERRWMAAVADLGCIACSTKLSVFSPAEIHHIYGKTADGCHFHILPLCQTHHRGGSGSGMSVSRHPWKERFTDTFGTEHNLWLRVVALVGYNPLEDDTCSA